jgi:threonylcarbamoyladenosine tRNA methylthiotransferase MtaB
VVTGCFAELKPEEIKSIEGVDLIIGNNEKSKFLDFLHSMNNSSDKIIDENINKEFFHAYSLGDRTRSFLKVQDGCNYFCSYCTIPFARGRSRNAPISELVKEAEFLAANGIKEIVLTGINIGDFGHTTGETFFQLVKALDKVDGISRFRMSSIEPDLLTDEIVQFVAKSKKFMPHFHIPLQAGSDTILKKMNRKYTTANFQQKIESICNAIPEVGIGADVIVGFPGESEVEFNETFSFLKSLNLSYLHVFAYSERENTASVKLPDKVKDHVKDERSRILHQLSEEKKEEFYRKFVGKEMPVLFESRSKDGKMHGFTENYIKVEVPLQKKYFNCIVPVELINFIQEDMVVVGKIIEE